MEIVIPREPIKRTSIKTNIKQITSITKVAPKIFFPLSASIQLPINERMQQLTKNISRINPAIPIIPKLIHQPVSLVPHINIEVDPSDASSNGIPVKLAIPNVKEMPSGISERIFINNNKMPFKIPTLFAIDSSTPMEKL